MAQAVIDSHQHFWDPASGSCGWMTEEYASIRRVFAPADLEPELAASGVDATVLVQTWTSVPETQEFLAIAAEHRLRRRRRRLGGPDRSCCRATLAALRARADGRYLVGIRHLVHDEPDPNWLLRDDVKRGLAAVGRAGLVYDLLLRPREIPAALRTVEEFPDLRFVVDHIAKPDIRDRRFRPVGGTDAPLSQPQRGHVWCKLSGMVDRGGLAGLAAAGPAAVRRGSAGQSSAPSAACSDPNWPVCLVAGNYSRMKAALEFCLDGLSPAEHAAVMGDSAIAAYRLPDFVHG